MTATTTTKPTKTLPARSEVAPGDAWDLRGLYSENDAWERDFKALGDMVPRLEATKGRLGESAASLRAFLDLSLDADRKLDRINTYASCRSDEDTANGHYRGLKERVTGLVTRLAEATSFSSPEIMAIPDDRMKAFLADEALAPYRFYLEKVLRFKPHTLSEPEERILALSNELAQAPYTVFGQLDNADLTFGTVKDEKGEEVEVTHASYGSFLTRPDRDVRRRFFEVYYEGYAAHKHTLAATLSSGVKRNIFYARARRYKSARAASLFSNAIPEAVYDNLVASVRKNLETLYRYYDLRKRALKLDAIHFYDVLVPIVSNIEWKSSYDKAVEMVTTALAPLGDEYASTLRQGLLRGWVDRYENRGKRSGAYSSGCYDSDPFILLNYRDDNLNEVFTVAHEAGHSMHTLFSQRAQPYAYSGYSIFLAEVASTFNEELLTAHLLETTADPRLRAYIINRQVDAIRSTIFRQTMFAEFEHAIHARAEANEPLTLDDLTREYQAILERYYGPRFTIDPQLKLECLRIPHFYYNFYVFQYSTGLSASIALARKVLAGEAGALDRYLGFLRAGGSRYPIDVLREAGVDMTTPEPVDQALAHFGRLVEELDSLLAQIG